MYHMGEEQCEGSNDSETSSNGQVNSDSSSSWDESSEAASIPPPGDAEEGLLTEFLLDTFGNTDAAINDLIAL